VGTYRYLPVATGRCVHFVDICPTEQELAELIAELDEKGISVVYLDCASYAKGPPLGPQTGAASANPDAEGDDAGGLHWMRWWDDLLCMGHQSHGLAIVLDNADALFEADRRLMTGLIENFLHGATSWIKREVPCHLCLQMVPCPNVARAFKRRAAPPV